MKQEKIDRINELARKSKIEELTEAEREEQRLLRLEYLDDMRKNLMEQLDRTFLMDEDGNKIKLERRPKN